MPAERRITTWPARALTLPTPLEQIHHRLGLDHALEGLEFVDAGGDESAVAEGNALEERTLAAQGVGDTIEVVEVVGARF